jgi:S1-C subfamily serine protease
MLSLAGNRLSRELSLSLRGVVLVLWLVLPGGVAGQDKPANDVEPITFANLLIRLKNQSWIGAGDDELRIKLIEHVRKKGFPVLGAESLVFNHDKSADARFALGGTVQGLDCLKVPEGHTCRIEVQWELFDRVEERVVYQVVSRHRAEGLEMRTHAGRHAAAFTLLFGSLDGLLLRPKFLERLAKRRAAPLTASSFAPATFKGCGAPERLMPGATSELLPATVIVESASGLGSGVLISDDGLVLTAAHVVEPGELTIQLQSGQRHKAVAVRVHKQRDVALVRFVDRPAEPTACLPLWSERPAIGTELYAIGSPRGKELAFSVTRGIVSSLREVDGIEFLQTDASLNPGNSGGPMVDAQGRVLAIVSWGVRGAEGLGFGVPVGPGLVTLGLTATDTTTPELYSQVARPAAKLDPVIDTEDPPVSLDPVGDRARALSAFQRANTPAYFKVMRWLGLTTACAGLTLAFVSWARWGEPEFAMLEDFETQRRQNDAGWVLAGVGTASFIASYVFAPRFTVDDMNAANAKQAGAEKSGKKPAPSVSVGVHPAGRASLHVSV